MLAALIGRLYKHCQSQVCLSGMQVSDRAVHVPKMPHQAYKETQSFKLRAGSSIGHGRPWRKQEVQKSISNFSPYPIQSGEVNSSPWLPRAAHVPNWLAIAQLLKSIAPNTDSCFIGNFVLVGRYRKGGDYLPRIPRHR